jgi:hypothetical protein
MTLLPLGMQVNAGEIWRGSPCKLVGIVNEDEPDSFSQIKTPQQGAQGTPPPPTSSNASNDQDSATDLSTSLLERRPVKSIYDNYPDNALGAGYRSSGGSSPGVSARHVVPELRDGAVGAVGGIAQRQTEESRESKGQTEESDESKGTCASASSARAPPVARVRQKPRRRQKRRKRGRLFGCCAGVWQALAIAFISTIDIICFMPTTELYLYSVKAGPGSLLGMDKQPINTL